MKNNTMSLEQAIAEIVSKIPSNCIFDAHTVINELLANKKYREVYMQEYSGPIKNYHSNIAKKICKVLETGLEPIVERLKFDNDKDIKSYSHTIYGNLEECTCWRKK